MSIPEYMPLGHLLMVFTLSVFWSLVTLVKMVWAITLHGPKHFFYGKRRDSRPEVLDDPAYGTHHYARLKDIRLHYVSNGPDGAPLMLFVHGFPEFWYSWRHQLKEFSKDYRTVAFDMRGYGESEKPEGIPQYRMEKLAEDVTQLIGYLGYSSCVLVAHDWGGSVAWHFAAKHPDMVDRLVILDSPHSQALRQYARKHPSQLLKSWYMFMFQAPCLPESYLRGQDGLPLRQFLTDPRSGGMRRPRLSDDDIQAFLYNFRDFASLNRPINYYRAALRYKPERLPSHRVQCPCLIMWGGSDFFIETDLAAASKAYVDNDCTVSIVDGASHWLQQEEPEVVNSKIRDFLSG